jgi:hypothetical protein
MARVGSVIHLSCTSCIMAVGQLLGYIPLGGQVPGTVQFVSVALGGFSAKVKRNNVYANLVIPPALSTSAYGC